MIILRKVPDSIKPECIRIKTLLYENGVDETLATCETLWRGISYHKYGKEWIDLPNTNEELWEIICKHARVVD